MIRASATRVLRSLARRVGVALAILAIVLVTATVLTARRDDPGLWPPAPGAAATTIFVVSHGYHSGLVLPRRELVEVASRRQPDALAQVARRFAGFAYLEVGWGEEAFYREVPTLQHMTLALAARALLRPGNASVLHVVGVGANPRAMFAHSDLVRVELSAQGFGRLIEKLDASLARKDGRPQELGRGLYGTSLFYRANGTFHLFRVCNHWVADLLDAAGVPTAPLPATLPAGLLLDLEWRAGLTRLPPPMPP
jgi:uncharacterized protein (TIGR02117 family)